MGGTILVTGGLGNAGWKLVTHLASMDMTANLVAAADGSRRPEGFVIVNGMSPNAGLRWSLEEGRRWLQWEPVDGIDVLA